MEHQPNRPGGRSTVVTVDELRAMHQLTGLRLPRFVSHPGGATRTDSADNVRRMRQPAVELDAAALRGLAARDLARIGAAGAVVPSPELSDLLAPYGTPTLFVEIEVETAGVLRHVALAGSDAHGWASLTEIVDSDRVSGLLSLAAVQDTAHHALMQVCGLDAVADQPTGESFAVAAEAHADADELALQGDVPEAVAQLVSGGASEAAATAWVAAVRGRRGAWAVTAARTVEDAVEAADLRWLVAADGVAWRVTAGEQPMPVSVITPTDASVLRAALAEMVGARMPTEVAR